MSLQYKYNNFSDAYFDILSEIFLFGIECKPRNCLIKEICEPITIHIKNPRQRIINCDIRKPNYGFACGEFIWYWTGRNDLEMMKYYNKVMDKYSDDGETLNSAYGFRIRPAASTVQTQWNVVKEILTKDKDSRRAVMIINNSGDQRNSLYNISKDVPCTLSLQFYIRNNKLNLHAVMRSNDIILGFVYDCFSFSILQECMYIELKSLPGFENLELGEYHHTACSIHLYEKHFEMANNSLKQSNIKNNCEVMPCLKNIKDLNELCKDEQLLRTKKINKIDLSKHIGFTQFFAEQLNMHREKRDMEELSNVSK